MRPNDNYLIFAVFYYIGLHCLTVQFHWLLVICYILYEDIVKVFQDYIRKRYLKSCLFAWCLPVLMTLFCRLVIPSLFHNNNLGTWIELGFLFLPLIINAIIYIKLVISLLCNCHAGANTANNKWRRFYMVTLIFVLSDVTVLSAFTLHNYFPPPPILQTVLMNLQTITIDLFFPIFKRNRTSWHDYFFAKRSNNNIVLS